MKENKISKLILVILFWGVLSSFGNKSVLARIDNNFLKNNWSFQYTSLHKEGDIFGMNDEAACLDSVGAYLSKLPIKKSADHIVPASVLSPVIGPLRVTTSNQGVLGFWEFNRHMTGAHVPGGGWGNSNDTHAWDINLYLQGNTNADAGRQVFATAAGTVVGYTGSGLPNSCNAVLIAHPNNQNPEYYSGYLHLANYNISVGQSVSSNTVIGTIGRTCATNDHLHFVVYTGTNTNGGLVSFNTGITERTSCNNGVSTLRNIDNGPPIHPPGSLLKTASNPTVYLIDSESRKRAITSASVLAQLYNQTTSSQTSTDFTNWVITVGQDELDLYELGGNISAAQPGNGKPFPDGKLIGNSLGEISIVTGGGRRRPFTDFQRFQNLGYGACHIVTISNTDYNSYPAGPPVDAMPLLIQSVNLNPANPPYLVGQNISGSFTIKNVGYSPIPFASLVVGGLVNGGCCSDMSSVSLTLGSGNSHLYSGSRQLTSAGNWTFFAAYQENNGHWTGSVPALPGVIRSRQITVGTPTPTPTPTPTITPTPTPTITPTPTPTVTPTPTPTPTPQLPNRTNFDFDGDRKTDISIFRPSNGQWWINRSSTGQIVAAEFGIGSDKITPGDWTGDGKTDLAFWRPSTGQWFILRSEDNSFYAFPFGSNGDIPAPGDFDGDGKFDAAVFRPSNAAWYIQRSSGGITIQSFGTNGDVPVVADYDGDGKADISIFRPSNGQWWIQRSNLGLTAVQFGSGTDKPVQGDYTGDGKADVAVWRPGSGTWFVLRSEDLSFFSAPFGSNGDIPVPGDYDGDGRFDFAVFRPVNATWFIQRTTSGILIQSFGVNGDRPPPSSYIP